MKNVSKYYNQLYIRKKCVQVDTIFIIQHLQSSNRKRLWCWDGLGAGGEGDDRRWDGWMASSTWWSWVWVNSGNWSWTGRPGVLQFMGSQRVGHDWATELNWKYKRERESFWLRLQKGTESAPLLAFSNMTLVIFFDEKTGTWLKYTVILVQFSHLVVSDSFRPHGLQHARLTCLLPAPRACSNSFVSN